MRSILRDDRAFQSSETRQHEAELEQKYKALAIASVAAATPYFTGMQAKGGQPQRS
ncbi:MAG: hypothetical protein AAF638_08315 [Pseudomonadota bacterium]